MSNEQIAIAVRSIYSPGYQQQHQGQNWPL